MSREKALRDLLLPTIRMRGLDLSDAAEEAASNHMIALHEQSADMADFGRRVRFYLDGLNQNVQH